MRIRCFSTAAGALLAAVLTPAVHAADSAGLLLYVATNGNDAWSGRLAEPNATKTDGPLATPGRARDEIRRLKAAGQASQGTTVLVRAGVYYLEEPLRFGPEDSGTAQAPITYAAYPGETPVLSGGRRITRWVRPAQGQIWTAEVPEVKAGAWYFHQLFVDGQRRVRARIPNEGYLLHEGPIEPLVDRAKARLDNNTKMGFRYKPGDLKPWTNLDDVNVIQFHSWTASLHWIKELDEQNSVVRFTAPSDWPTSYWTKNERYYVENVSEGLDAAGEWYLDRATGALRYWPIPGEDPTAAQVVAPRLRHLVLLEGDAAQGRFVEHIIFKGLSFQHADWHIPDRGKADGQAAVFVDAAVMARAARHCALERCEVAHVGEYGLWLGMGSQENRIVHCHVHDLGAGGIKIGETQKPDDERRAVRGNTVDNCFIHDAGHVFHGGVGVWIGSSSHNAVTHNEICDLDYTGVSVGWRWGYGPSSAHHNLVEWNHIHHIGRGVLGDMGGVYTLGISPGTRIRHNVIHDVYSPGIGGGAGIYPDEGSSEILIENNLVYNTESGCFSQHYGRENTVRNNIFALSLQGEVARYRQEDHLSFSFERNIVYSQDGYLLLGNWSNGNYRIEHNLCWDTSTPEPDFAGLDFEQWQALGRDQHSLLADPGFVNARKFDFRLKPGSPAEKIGFQPFDMASVGLYGEPEWIGLPKTIVRRPIEHPPVPKRGPQPINDGFESTPVGQPAALAVTSGEQQGVSIRVSDAIAAGGRRSLKFTDAPGLTHSWQPHLYYHPRFNKGIVRLSYDLRLEPGAIFVHEWRDAASPYLVGPSITVDTSGQLSASSKSLMSVPIGSWIHFEFVAGLGKQATGTYDLTVTPQGQAGRKFEGLSVGKRGWNRLAWLGFISLANNKTVMYLDNLKLEAK